MTGGFVMIIAAVAAAAVAVFQFYLDTVLFRSVFESKALKAVGMLLIKLGVYAGAFALLFLCFRDYVTGAAVGFGLGLFPSIFLYGFLTLRKKR